MNPTANSVPSGKTPTTAGPTPLSGADVIHTLAHHLRSLSISTSAAAAAAAQENTNSNKIKNGNGTIVASLLSFTTRRSTATSAFQRDPRSRASVPILTPPVAPPSAGRFAARPTSIVASTIHSNATAAASRYDASLAPMNTVTLTAAAAGSTMIPSPTTRLTLDPMHLAYLEHRFRTSPRVRKYLGLPPMPSSGTAGSIGASRDASGGGWGLGSWFGGTRSTASPTVPAAEDQQLLYIFQCFEQLRSLRLTPVAKRPIADWSPTTSATTTSLHNLSSVEFKGVLPSSVDLTELSMQITVLVVQSHVESLDQVLTYPSFTRLSLLDLSSNSLAATDATILARAPLLADLILHANQLTDFPDISPLAHLTHLDLSFNQVTALPPASTTPHLSLQRLNLHANKVTSLATLPDLFPNLIQLVASKNLLDHIPPLSRLASLADVQLWGNPIHEADDTGYRVQIAAQFQDRVAHVVVDGQRLVPLPPMPGKRKQGSAATGVKARVVKLEGDGDGGDLGSPRSPTSPPKAGKRSPLASQVDLANVKEEDEGEEVDDRVSSRSDWRSAAMRPPTRTNSDPTMRRTAHAPTSAHVGGGTTAADAALAEERIRRKIDELKKQGGAQNWMRQMVSEAAGRQRMPHAAVAASQSASASADVGDGTAAGRVDTGAHTPTSGVAGSTSAGSPIHRPRSTGSLRQQAPATLTPAVPTTSNTPSPRHGHGRKPSTTASYASPPQPASTDTLPHNPSSSHPSPALSPPHSPTMGHADSALATTPPRPPQLHAHIAHHQKPRRSLAKRTALTYSPLLLSDSLVELPLADTIAARITCTPATCWGQLTCRATRAAGIGYVTVKYDGERADEVAKRWAHVLAREVKANQARGHVVDVCPRGECVVCGVTGWVPDHVGKRRNPANGDVEGEGEVVVGEVDGRTGRYLDVRVREKSGVGAKGQVECAKCGTVVAVYFGTSLES